MLYRQLAILFTVLGFLTLSVTPSHAGGPIITNGDPCNPPGQQTCGDPINLLGGNMYLEVGLAPLDC